jgi:hypothetical protein
MHNSGLHNLLERSSLRFRRFLRNNFTRLLETVLIMGLYKSIGSFLAKIRTVLVLQFKDEDEDNSIRNGESE